MNKEFKRREAEVRHAFCSACGEQSDHAIIESNDFGRARFQCSYCGQKTTKCLICDAMAQVPDDGRAHKFCVVHNGGAGSFDALSQTVSCPSEFVPLLTRRDGANVARRLKIGLGAVTGVAAVGTGAWIAAPALGGALGSYLLGLSGAAASSAGLAMLGGGSIASGGLGMLGGTAVLSAIGGLGGSAIGGLLSNQYLSDVRNFGIHKIRDGDDPALVFIDGFLTEKSATAERWLNGIGERYKEHAAYHVTWESKRLRQLGTALSTGVGQKALIEFAKVGAARASRVGASKLTPLSIGANLIGMANNPWFVALVKAEKTGELLKEALARSKGRSFTLVGHSLGARVAYFVLAALGTIEPDERKSRIIAAHLLGGAVGSEPATSWEPAADVVNDKIYNYHSDNDMVLKLLYGSGRLLVQSPAIGTRPIPVTDRSDRKIESIDVTNIVSGHTRYHEALSRILR